MHKMDNTYLLTYLLHGSRSIQSLHVRDFEPMHRVRGRASTGSIAFGLATKPSEVKNIYRKHDIRISPIIGVIPSGALPNL